MRINLSEQAKDILISIHNHYLIYKQHHPSDSCHSRLFSGHFLFSSSDNRMVMPSIAELCSKRMIRFFSDKRVMISNEGISYIEKQLASQNDMRLWKNARRFA